MLKPMVKLVLPMCPCCPCGWAHAPSETRDAPRQLHIIGGFQREALTFIVAHWKLTRAAYPAHVIIVLSMLGCRALMWRWRVWG